MRTCVYDSPAQGLLGAAIDENKPKILTRKELIMEIVGHISQSVIETLGLKLEPGTPVFIGESNIAHIKSRHPYEYDVYYKDIGAIINSPDYVGLNPKDGSILFVKLYRIDEDYIRVAVKITAGGKCFAKTLHSLSTCNAERYIEKGTLKKLDTN